MDYFIVVVTTVAGLYFHGWLYVRMRRWMDRDLALSLAGEDVRKREYMLRRLEQARVQKVRRKALAEWLAREAAAYQG
ncbi:hypothetical protein OGV25_20235 [Pseudomonas sp. P1B16]|jgi:hypothetical protein|uniref:30S ribosomal protein S3 n=1 Tax=Pseudomonas capeferrum TaxID=1495066 RepID=A0ABY7R6K1_9PSED|nr:MULTISPECIES: hypothetical protein [Pseudomonas]KEY85279.1 hypothetical protein PC358_22570 [Pseudomonas capeferrum]KGI91451.1 30S ribosomal protein S3 [Pseudomonas sp. H2]MBC3481251.1 hypothetical protein [Pseudomonas sp. SWRI77]MBC3500818.1 hypothetical protein [Pseudomonas sp. SWRI59]MBC3506581.1 hypothetical protein [Pseudomonas sp. SWRI68]